MRCWWCSCSHLLCAAVAASIGDCLPSCASLCLYLFLLLWFSVPCTLNFHKATSSSC
ncbi:hypothetical protein ACP70R_000284 [Stipagrostis hirtigluma subsp. patula]